jgi:hypothetical protein
VAKEAIFIGRLLKAMILKRNEAVIINCDTTQTLRLTKQETAKLITQIQHTTSTMSGIRHETGTVLMESDKGDTSR